MDYGWRVVAFRLPTDFSTRPSASLEMTTFRQDLTGQRQRQRQGQGSLSNGRIGTAYIDSDSDSDSDGDRTPRPRRPLTQSLNLPL